MYKHILWESQDGSEAYVDLIGSRAGKCISSQPSIAAFAKQALASNLPVQSGKTYIEHCFGKDIGVSYIVDTTDADVIYYARNSKGGPHRRYVKNRQPVSTQHITIVLHKDSDGDYEITDLWLGTYVPQIPDASSPDTESYQYWSSHAEIADMSAIQISSITHDCPYDLVGATSS